MGQHNPTPEKRPHKPDSVKGHVVSFILSLVLTALAFAAVMYEETSKDLDFLVPFLLFLAIVQAAAQMYIWMHLKDKDHEFPSIFIAGGIVVALTCVPMALFWVWW